MADINQIVESLKKAMEDYSQLKRGYPNAQKFLNAFVENVKKVAPPNPMDTQASQEYAMNRAFDAPMLGAIKAYHGSPHKFDKFDMSKIGTGEGAQAYGHGLYFAESPDTAKYYADKLVNDTYTPSSNNAAEDYIIDKIEYYRNELGASPDKTDILEWIRSDGKLLNDGYDDFNYNDVMDSLDAFYNKFPKSNVYETSLQWPDAAREAADPLGPQHFLDWDKTLDEQPSKVRRALNNLYYENSDAYPMLSDAFQPFETSNTKGSSIHSILSKRGLDESGNISEAKDLLQKYDIPGIRYLDQGSRGAGNGTYNYVVFDDKIPKIISINGKGLLGEVKK